MRSRFEHSRWSCARISHILNSDHSMVSKQSKRILVCGAHLVWSSSVERWECTSLYICKEYISITEWRSCSSEHLDKQIELNYNRLENHCDEDNSEMFFSIREAFCFTDITRFIRRFTNQTRTRSGPKSTARVFQTSIVLRTIHSKTFGEVW